MKPRRCKLRQLIRVPVLGLLFAWACATGHRATTPPEPTPYAPAAEFRRSVGGALRWIATFGHPRFKHGFALYAADASRDGTWAAVAGASTSIVIWDLPYGNRRRELRSRSASTLALAISADDRRIIGGGSDGLISVWDAASANVERTFRADDNPITDLRRTSSARRVAASSEDGTIRVWDIESGLVVSECRPSIGPVEFDVSARGGAEILGASDGAHPTELRKLDGAGESRTLEVGDAGSTLALRLEPRGRWLASATTEGTVNIQDLATGRVTATLRLQDRTAATDLPGIGVSALDEGTVALDDFGGEEVHALAISPDSSLLAWGDIVGTLAVWDVSSARPSWVRSAHVEEIAAISFTGDGRWVVTASRDGTVGVWSAATGESPTPDLRTGAVADLVATPDSLLTATSHGFLGSWDRKTHELRVLSKQPFLAYRGIVHDASRERILTAGIEPTGLWGVLESCDDWRLRPVDTLHGYRISRDPALAGLRATLGWDFKRPNSIAQLGASGEFAVPFEAGVLICDPSVPADGRTVPVLEGHPVRDIAVDQSGELLVSATANRLLVIQDPSKAQNPMHSLTLAAPASHVALWAPNETVAFASADTGEVHMWRYSHDGPTVTLGAHRGRCVGLEFGESGSVLFTVGEDRRLCVWDTEARKLVDEMPLAHAPTSLRVAGSTVFVGCRESIVHEYVYEAPP